MPSSYNGWPASRDPQVIGVNQTWEPIPGHRFPGGIKAGDVEVVFTYLVVNLDARVEPIDLYAPGDEWGWFYKPSANSPDTLSCHSSATAIDYNATRHPNGRRGTFTPTQVAEIRKIQAECSGVIGWLGDATHIPDEMHFEIRGTAAQVAAAAAKLTSAPHPIPVPVPVPPQEADVFLCTQKSTGHLWLFEADRRTLISDADDKKAALASTIPRFTAEDALFVLLAKDRTRVQ